MHERTGKWLNECDETLYSMLTFQGGAAMRSQLLADTAVWCHDPSTATSEALRGSAAALPAMVEGTPVRPRIVALRQ